VSVRAIIPQKLLPVAKSRLEGVLPARARAALSLALLRTVCTTLRAVGDVQEVIIMTPDPEVRATAAGWGVRAVPDPRPELNHALAEAFLGLVSGVHGILVVAADLPMVTPADILALLHAGRTGAVALAPAKEGIGTNAMLLPPGVTLRPAYGWGSLAVHRDRARELGLGVVEIRRPGLAFDLDSEADLLSFPHYSKV
jgi:2-phospho-L-lactate/phosphoenolpyruvate guanylyltransferase